MIPKARAVLCFPAFSERETNLHNFVIGYIGFIEFFVIHEGILGEPNQIPQLSLTPIRASCLMVPKFGHIPGVDQSLWTPWELREHFCSSGSSRCFATSRRGKFMKRPRCITLDEDRCNS